MTDTHISERYEFRNIKQNEAEEAAEEEAAEDEGAEKDEGAAEVEILEFLNS